MPHTIEVTRDTYEKLMLAARMTNSSPGEIVARMIASATAPITDDAPPKDGNGVDTDTVDVYATYEGHRTTGEFNPQTRRLEITSGPLSGESYKTPSAAARRVIESHNPEVNSNRNGWSFWLLDEGDAPLQTIRH